MNVPSPAARPDRPPRPRRRMRRAGLAAAGAALAAGAFLLWGPIGLGNGPLHAGVSNGGGWADTRGEPVGFIIPVHNLGHARVVIDGVDLIGGTRYGDPRVLALRVLTSGRCGGAWPARRTSRGFVLSGCGGADAGPLIGHAFGPDPGGVFFGFPAAAEVSAPRPGTCWVLTKVVVHYHVGIRHYSSSGPYQLAVCASRSQVAGAVQAAAAS